MKRKELTPEQLKRRRLRAQKYYQEHREQILAHNREYYRQKGRAWHAERVRKYRHANHEAYLAKRREYRANHLEYFRQMDQKYRQRHLVSISRKTIGEYCYRAIEKIQKKCPKKVDKLLQRYPFEGFASQRLRRQLRYFHIYPSQARYDDCYDAGMMAYLYTIHRCAYMGYSYVEAYMTKLIRIYLICAAIVFPDAQNLCRENNLRELNLDRLPYVQI